MGTATAHERDCGDGFATELNAATQEFVEKWQRRNKRTTGRDEDYRELEEVLSPAGAAWGSTMHGMLWQWSGG
jgi:hypothetical protein